MYDVLFLCDLRSHLGSASDLRFSVVEGQDGHYSTTVIRRAQKGRLSALRDDPNKVQIVVPTQQLAHIKQYLQSHMLTALLTTRSFFSALYLGPMSALLVSVCA